MLHLGVSILLLFLGLGLVRATSQRRRRSSPEKSAAHTRCLAAEGKALQLCQEWATENARLTQIVMNLRTNSELDQQIAHDAVRRENRAKEALRAVLRQHHCSDAQIEKVLSAVDGEPV